MSSGQSNGGLAYVRSEGQRLFFALVLLVSGLLAVRFGEGNVLRFAGWVGIAVSVIFLIVAATRLARQSPRSSR